MESKDGSEEAQEWAVASEDSDSNASRAVAAACRRAIEATPIGSALTINTTDESAANTLNFNWPEKWEQEDWRDAKSRPRFNADIWQAVLTGVRQGRTVTAVYCPQKPKLLARFSDTFLHLTRRAKAEAKRQALALTPARRVQLPSPRPKS